MKMNRTKRLEEFLRECGPLGEAILGFQSNYRIDEGAFAREYTPRTAFAIAKAYADVHGEVYMAIADEIKVPFGILGNSPVSSSVDMYQLVQDVKFFTGVPKEPRFLKRTLPAVTDNPDTFLCQGYAGKSQRNRVITLPLVSAHLKVEELPSSFEAKLYRLTIDKK